ncbi:MAG: LysR family transcriptional regulator [Bdellovibrionales bacterium]|nr:LysR family transcriptional regulator [Bdellovibrionales bacterium]
MLENLRIKDLAMLSQIPFSGSIRELARQQKVDPQNLTKRILSIEESLGYKILNRSSKGYSISPEGEIIIEIITSALSDIESVRDVERISNEKIRLRFCSRAYITEFVSGEVFAEFANSLPEVTFDFTDMSPERTERAGRMGLLDLIASFDDVVLGPEWQSINLGQIDWGVFVRKGHPLTKKPVISSLHGWQTVGFCYIEANRFIAKPSPIQKQMLSINGPGSENTRYSAQIIRHTDAVAYLPKIAMTENLERGEIIELEVEAIEPYSRQLVLHAHVDRVKRKWLDQFAGAIKRRAALV